MHDAARLGPSSEKQELNNEVALKAQYVISAAKGFSIKTITNDELR